MGKRLYVVWLRKWKDRIGVAAKGGWTNAIILNLDEWMSRILHCLNFHLIQVFSSYGCFNRHRIDLHAHLAMHGKRVIGGTPHCWGR